MSETSQYITNSSGHTIKDILELSNMTQSVFCRSYGIPKTTLADWMGAKKKPAVYLLDLLEFKVRYDITDGEMANE